MNYIKITSVEYLSLKDNNGYYLAEDMFGSKEYYLNGELHRMNGPASILTNGFKLYY